MDSHASIRPPASNFECFCACMHPCSSEAMSVSGADGTGRHHRPKVCSGVCMHCPPHREISTGFAVRCMRDAFASPFNPRRIVPPRLLARSRPRRPNFCKVGRKAGRREGAGCGGAHLVPRRARRSARCRVLRAGLVAETTSSWSSREVRLLGFRPALHHMCVWRRRCAVLCCLTSVQLLTARLAPAAGVCLALVRL